MADTIIGAEAFYNATDVSGLGVEWTPAIGGDVHESRPFNASLVRKDGGMRNDAGSISGINLSSEPWQTMFADTLTTVPFSFLFDIGTYGAAAAEGDNALFGDFVNAGIQPDFQNGNLGAWTLPINASPLVLGFVVARGTKVASGNTTTPIEFTGAIAAGQSLYAVVHCPTATSGTVDVTIESDATSAFAGAETTRITFTQITTTATAQFLSWSPAAGETDTFYRAKWVSATTPSHNIAVAIGIQ